MKKRNFVLVCIFCMLLFVTSCGRMRKVQEESGAESSFHMIEKTKEDEKTVNEFETESHFEYWSAEDEETASEGMEIDTVAIKEVSENEEVCESKEVEKTDKEAVFVETQVEKQEREDAQNNESKETENVKPISFPKEKDEEGNKNPTEAEQLKQDTVGTEGVHEHDLYEYWWYYPDCVSRGYYFIRCRLCDFEETGTDETKLAPLGHRPDEGVVTKPPTCMHEGKMEHHCTVCQAALEDTVIPADCNAHVWVQDELGVYCDICNQEG